MSPLLLGAALGATSAFIFDPQQGPRRRALVREKVVRGRQFVETARKDRVRGVLTGAAAVSVLYAFARGGFGALVPLAFGAALLACSVSASAREPARRSAGRA